jgi:hypothetical protein
LAVANKIGDVKLPSYLDRTNSRDSMEEDKRELCMDHPQHDSFPDPAEPDDIDRLFNRLAPLEPPRGIIARILDSISRISPRPTDPELSWDNDSQVDGLVVRNEKQEPS